MKSLITTTWERPGDALIQDITYVLAAILSKSNCGKMPRLAVLAIYQSLIHETARFHGKMLRARDGFPSPRNRDGRISDVEILSTEGKLFEAAIVHHGVPICMDRLKKAERDFKTSSVDRVYLLSTLETPAAEMRRIAQEVERISSAHGFELIVDGVVPTISYYLRILDDPQIFTKCFVDFLEDDKTMDSKQKQHWNELILSHCK